MRTVNTPEVHALTGPYVLNALPEDERIDFETHLDDCRSCSAEVAELREVANQLGAAVAVPPPAALKARVLAEAAQTRQLPPVVRDVVAARRRRRGMSRRSFFSLAAAGAAVAGSGAIALDQYRDNTRTKEQQEQLAGVLAERDAKTVRGPVNGGGEAVVVVSARTDKAVVLLHGLRKLPDDKTYQLWLLDKSQTAHSVGLASGRAKSDHTTVINGGVADKVMFGLTVEDKPGAAQPTLPAATLIAIA